MHLHIWVVENGVGGGVGVWPLESLHNQFNQSQESKGKGLFVVMVHVWHKHGFLTFSFVCASREEVLVLEETMHGKMVVHLNAAW